MLQLVLKITDEIKGKFLIDFLQQLDFVEISETRKAKQKSLFEKEIAQSVSDLKNGKVTSWKGKQIVSL